MADLTRRIAVLADVDAWFAKRGLGLVISLEDGQYWANLFGKQSLQIGAPRYGGGSTPEEAAETGRERYKEEEEGPAV